jgi:MFS family permease
VSSSQPFIKPIPLQSRILRGLRLYASKLRLFKPNARLYLLNTVVNGVAYGILRLLFNFYALSLGYDEALVGQLITVTSLVALIGALPAGYLSDRIGRKPSLLLSNLTFTLSVIGMVFWRTPTGFYMMNAMIGLAQSLMGVTMGPFLMENSDEEERTYLFSFNAGFQTTAGFAGNWLGGRLPTWLGTTIGVSATSSTAYGWAIAVISGISLLGILPLMLLKRQRTPRQADEVSLSPFQYARKNPKLLGKLVAPMLVTSLGAGLLMPFMNIFFRVAHTLSDATIGSLFAWGSLAMGIGFLIAPPLADRWGKIQVVVVSQALSIPFLILLGFAPLYWISATAYLVRLALMNMSGPIYNTFVMEHAEPEARATVASLVSMSWNFGWAFSPTLSGWLQVRYGFNPVFLGTISTYILAIFLYWYFFLHESDGRQTKDQGLGIRD